MCISWNWITTITSTQGFLQVCNISIINILQILQSCTRPSIIYFVCFFTGLQEWGKEQAGILPKSMQTCPQPLEQHFCSSGHSTSYLHSSTHVPTTFSAMAGHSPSRGTEIQGVVIFMTRVMMKHKENTVKCHYNACHYNANASLTRSILGSQTAPTCPHDHPRVAQHMGYRCEIIAVWSATAAMTPLCSHTNGMKQRYPTCWLCQYSRFMIDLRSNTLIIHLRCSENAINRPIWLPDARMLKTISVA